MSNTIIKILNNAGYTNKGTNRERVVRNLNLLIDAGVLQIDLIEADKYNAKEGGTAFWYTAQDGKRYCTAYKVTIFGKMYLGHYIQKSKTTKFKHIEYMDGTIEYATNTEYFNNSYLDLSSIMLRVAQLISIIKGKGDFSGVNFAADGNYSVNVAGQLTMHGTTKDVSAIATIKIAVGKIDGSTKFYINPRDYNVKIPDVVKGQISNKIEAWANEPTII
jgi:hypothetical protein